jgi:hypothetical protein
MFTEHLAYKAEVIAQTKVVTDIEYSLAMLLYDMVIKNDQDKLSQFDGENPFIPLSIYRSLPQSYHGAVKNKDEITGPGWYFDLDSRNAIYRFEKKDVEDVYIKMVWVIDDINHDGVQDENEVGYLKIERGLIP